MRRKNAFDLFDTAFYIRLSREDGDKEESDSIGNQRKVLSGFMAGKEDMVFSNEYIDDGFTGTNFNRPGFQEMMKDVDAGKVNCVIVKDLSRFGRDYIDTGRYLERVFPERGVRFISIMDGIDSHKQAYDMLLPIKNIFNEQYSRDISKKIQATVKSKQRAGEFIGAFASYGYRKSPLDNNKLVIDEYAAEVVRRIFAMYIDGFPISRIARILSAEGILCPSDYKAANSENYKNAKRLESTTYWTYVTIKTILGKEIYLGNMVQGTKHQRMRSKQKLMHKEDWIIVENTHEGIISKETWEKTQTLLKKRAREGASETKSLPLSGFVKCGDCGRAMARKGWKRSDGSETNRLYCGTYQRIGKNHCSPHKIHIEVLESIVLGDLKTIVQSIENLRELIQSQEPAMLYAEPQPQSGEVRIKETLLSFHNMAELEISKKKSELDRIRRLKKSVYEDYKEGMISQEEFFSYREDYLKKEELFLQQIKSLDGKRNENMVSDIYQMPWIKKLLTLREIEELDRDIVSEMIDQILVYEDNRIRIRYNFSNELEKLFASTYTKV